MKKKEGTHYVYTMNRLNKNRYYLKYQLTLDKNQCRGILISKNDPNSLLWAWEEDDNVYCAYEMMEYILQ